MERPPAPPSSSFGRRTSPDSRGARARPDARRTPGARGERRVDVQGWLGGIRLSGFMVVMLGLVVLAAFVLVPTVGMYVAQRQEIAALERSVERTQDEIDQLRAQRERWGDPAYVTTQARERLYYQWPGEIVYLVDNDLAAGAVPDPEAPVSAEVTVTETDWMTQMLGSVVSAGIAETVTEAPRIGVDG